MGYHVALASETILSLIDECPETKCKGLLSRRQGRQGCLVPQTSLICPLRDHHVFLASHPAGVILQHLLS
jgi:hypothetical protein